MANKVEGEFEVLLGNRQLLSIFFIVVILLAVFFTMGYVLGRGSSVGFARVPTASNPPAEKSRPSGFADLPAEPPAAKPGKRPAESPITQPQQRPPAAEPARTAPTPASLPKGISNPAAGQVFLQATAAKRPDAELVASVLKKKGFPVVLAPGPNESVFRVLVGPFADSGALAKMRAELDRAGFNKAFTRKY